MIQYHLYNQPIEPTSAYRAFSSSLDSASVSSDRPLARTDAMSFCAWSFPASVSNDF